MSSIKCVLLLCRFRSCDSSAAIPERSPTPLHYPLIRLLTLLKAQMYYYVFPPLVSTGRYR